MRKASTWLPEQGTQTPSPAPDLIPAEPKNQPSTHIAIGTANGDTSQSNDALKLTGLVSCHVSPLSDLCMFIDKFRRPFG